MYGLGLEAVGALEELTNKPKIIQILISRIHETAQFSKTDNKPFVSVHIQIQ